MRVGFEIEEVIEPPAITGPLVVGLVTEIEELTGLKKPIRWCQVQVGPDRTNGIICGARNFVVGDLVVVSLPGAVPARRLHDLRAQDLRPHLRRDDRVVEGAGHRLRPRRYPRAAPRQRRPRRRRGAAARPGGRAGHQRQPGPRATASPCAGWRGEIATATDNDFTDPATRVAVAESLEAAWPVALDDPGCLRFVARRVNGVDPARPAPWWMQRRLLAAGMRPISLIVDVTNYVMLELGQPLHAYDAGKLSGGIIVRRATAGEKLTTLDDAVRTLDPDDLLITDDSGPIGLAGVMGGASTEISPTAGGRSDSAAGGPIDVLLEAAHFEPAVIARGARRHKLPSEASKRFERTVDPRLPPVAAERAAQLLVEHGGGTIAPGRTDAGAAPVATPVWMPLDQPDRVAGVKYAPGATVPAAGAGRVRRGARHRRHRARRRQRDPRRRGGRTWSSPPTSSRRCSGWRAST